MSHHENGSSTQRGVYRLYLFARSGGTWLAAGSMALAACIDDRSPDIATTTAFANPGAGGSTAQIAGSSGSTAGGGTASTSMQTAGSDPSPVGAPPSNGTGGSGAGTAATNTAAAGTGGSAAGNSAAPAASSESSGAQMAPLDPGSSGATSSGATSAGTPPGSGASTPTTPSTPACTLGDEGCGCLAAGTCSEGLVCDAGSCRAVVCGDARVDPGEECDDGNQDDADSCTNACLNRYNVAFVTSTVFTIGSMGGVRGADTACNARARAAGLPGNFAAYIADSQSSLAARFGAARGWVRPDGKPFLDELDSPATFFPPNQTELGLTVSNPPVALGNPGAGDCEDWTSTSDAAGFFSAGDPAGGSGGWNGAANGIACGASFRLYCLQKDFSSILRVTPTPGRSAFVSADPWAPSGGLAGADALCQSDAQNAGLTGTFRALLATSTASAASRFSTSGTPWVRLDGIPIVTSPADLATAQFIAPLQLTSQFVYLINDGGWSGSASPQMAGTLASTCNDWQSSSNGSTGTAGRVQFSSFANAFAFDNAVTCDAPFTHLYCLEQ